jgi:diaminohydroxyphosphoribosylaminopyrimidine deaminase/5-amino-6-(5-phosphoribosylamino)uracil reductase
MASRSPTIYAILSSLPTAVLVACGVIPFMRSFSSQDFGFPGVDLVPLEDDTVDSWGDVPALLRALQPLPPPWEQRFGPLRTGAVDDLVVVGQFGQSLDGRVATESGHSHYINGPEGLAHLHRLRAVVDAVVVGIGTALADDPQLTVRHVSGPNPARVVIDPRGRLRTGARLFAANGVRRLALSAEGTSAQLPAGVERVTLPAIDGVIAPAAILAALAERGFRRIMIEGGSYTVSQFLMAGCLDRLHIVVAPIILGAGRGGVALPPVARCEDALRPPMRLHRLDGEVLFDCDLSARRIAVGRAKTST